MARSSAVFAVFLAMISGGLRPVSAEPTTLNLMPTAATLPANVIIVGFYTSTVCPSSGKLTENIAETEYGIGGRFEFGVDPYLIQDDRVLLNCKYRFLDESQFTPATAIGIQNTGVRLASQPYIVSYKTFPIARLHFGVLGGYGGLRAMFGIEKKWGPLFTLQADYMSGTQNWLTFGFVAGGTTGWQLNPAWLIGNSTSSGSGYFINLQWGAQL